MRPKNAHLEHGLAIQSPLITRQRPQRLARVAHAVVLPLEDALRAVEALAPVEEVRAVDGPVAEGAQAGEAEGAWGQAEGVEEVVS